MNQQLSEAVAELFRVASNPRRDMEIRCFSFPVFTLAFLLVETLLLAGCVAYKGAFKREIEAVTPGYTTRTEVHTLFGEPIFTSDIWPVELYYQATVPPSHAVVVYDEIDRVRAIEEDPDEIEGYVFQTGMWTHHGLLAPEAESHAYLARLLDEERSPDQCLLLVTTDYTAPTIVDNEFLGRASKGAVLILELSPGLHNVDVSYCAWQQRKWSAYKEEVEIDCPAAEALVLNIEGDCKDHTISLSKASKENLIDKRIILHSIFGGR